MDTRPIDELNENPKNPRTMSDHSGNALATSMKEFGDMSGIVFNVRTKHLVGGHQRIKVLNRLLKGKKEVVITNNFAEPDHVGTVALGYVAYDNRQFAYREVDWDEGRELAANVAANRISGEFNIDMLAQVNYELSQLENGSGLLELTGQTNDEINKLLDMVGVGGEADPLEDVPPPVDDANPAVSQLGEIYQLGNHRLMCGDATDFGQVSDLLNGEAIDLVLTDPPYGIDIVKTGSVGGGGDPTNGGYAYGGSKNTGTIGATNIAKAKQYAPIVGDETTVAAKKSYEVCKEIGIKNYIIWGGNYFTDFLDPSACWVVWDKQNTGNFADVEMAWTSFDKGAKLYHYLWNGLSRQGNRQDELVSRVHPTQKPVGMQADILKDFTEREAKVLDMFGGSGSCLIACQKMDRICYMMELSEAYCDVIRKRYAQQMGLEDWKTATPIINAPVAPVEPVAPLPGDRLDETPKE